MSSRFWLAAASYFVLTFVFAAAWHLALFKNLYARLGAFSRPRPIIALGVLSILLQALVVAYLYPLYYRGGTPVVEGATFGLLLGVFMGSSAVVAEAGKTQITDLQAWITLDGVYYLLQFAVVGAVVGLLYGPSWASRLTNAGS